jgi:hypothetical protein
MRTHCCDWPGIQIGDEETMIAEWGVPCLCRAFSIADFLLILRGLLTELPVIVICENLGVLSSIVYAPQFPGSRGYLLLTGVILQPLLNASAAPCRLARNFYTDPAIQLDGGARVASPLHHRRAAPGEGAT